MNTINVNSVYEELKKNRKMISRIMDGLRNKDVSGFTPPSMIVGEFNYPRVSMGVMFTTDDNARIYDAEKYWVEKGYSVGDIFSIRSSLINAKSRINVKEPESKRLEDIRLSVLSKDSVGLQVRLSGLAPGNGVSKFTAPHGINAFLDKIKINDNITMEKPVEKAFYDKDLKATDAINYLYENKIEDNKISRILSVGAVGVKRKLVPTKWAITAVDDTLGKSFIERAKELPCGDRYIEMHGGILGNMFTFLFIKGSWSFELIECWNRSGNSLFAGTGDHEFYYGRKDYARNTSGAYYAVRLAVLEKLMEFGEQYSVVVIREITPEYFVPLGVWVVREGARKALSGEMKTAENFDGLLKSARDSVLYLKDFDNRSEVIKFYKTQANLLNFY